MALIKCPKCGKEVSSLALKCPNCGIDLRSDFKKVFKPNWVIKYENASYIFICLDVLITIALLVLYFVFGYKFAPKFEENFGSIPTYILFYSLFIGILFLGAVLSIGNCQSRIIGGYGVLAYKRPFKREIVVNGVVQETKKSGHKFVAKLPNGRLVNIKFCLFDIEMFEEGE